MQLRRALPEELDRVFDIILDGKAALAGLGIDQWQGGSPTKEMIADDIANGFCYVVEEDGELLSTMAYVTVGEADYDNVIKGAWLLNDLVNVPEDGHAQYAVIHRVATSAKRARKGCASFMFQEASKMAKEAGLLSVRVDTHEGNHVMQAALERNGFTRCCDIIIAAELEPTKLRIGYERVL